jgi:hypothetical protein
MRIKPVPPGTLHCAPAEKRASLIIIPIFKIVHGRKMRQMFWFWMMVTVMVALPSQCQPYVP